MLRNSGDLPWIQSYPPPTLQQFDDLRQSLTPKLVAASEAHWNLSSTSRAAALFGPKHVGPQQLHSSASRSLATCATAHAGHVSTLRAEQSSLRDKVQATLAVASMFGFYSSSTASTNCSADSNPETADDKATTPVHLARATEKPGSGQHAQ